MKTSKQETRIETAEAIIEFLKNGGHITLEKPQRNKKRVTQVKPQKHYITGGDAPEKPKSVMPKVLELLGI